MTISRILTIATCLLLFLGGLFVYLNHESWDESTRLGSFFAVFLLGGILLGVLVFMHVLPWIGDSIGGSVYSSGESMTDDGSGAAIAKMAQGDYEGAILEYEKQREENPHDTFAIGEIAKIHADKLDDPDSALAYLSAAIESQEWIEDDTGFLLFRVVDTHVGAMDFANAKAVLEQITETLPGTRHAANANHRIPQLEEEEFLAKQKAAQEARKEKSLSSTIDDDPSAAETDELNS